MPLFNGAFLGVNLRDLVPRTTVKLEDLSGKSLAIDAYNALYQFLAIIRQPLKWAAVQDKQSR
jgi:5'-3' exonuclease